MTNVDNTKAEINSIIAGVQKLHIVQHSLTEFQRKVYAYTKMIPRGQVSTYKNIAIAIGRPGSSRAVGTALSKNPFAPDVPCHRVICSDYKIGGFNGQIGECSSTRTKIELLQSEGIVIENGRLSKAVGYREKIGMIPTGQIRSEDLTDASLAEPI
jgi:methylated-DNA-[protein]-cysteine S-methyltransferase